jgi:hypothetical protein
MHRYLQYFTHKLYRMKFSACFNYEEYFFALNLHRIWNKLRVCFRSTTIQYACNFGSFYAWLEICNLLVWPSLIRSTEPRTALYCSFCNFVCIEVTTDLQINEKLNISLHTQHLTHVHQDFRSVNRNYCTALEVSFLCIILHVYADHCWFCFLLYLTTLSQLKNSRQ